MNIFFLDKDPFLAAIYACDKHCVKMIVESAQILSTVHYLYPNDVYIEKINLYKPSFKNHPCVIWAGKSISNYLWLSDYALKLCKEYTFRYEKIHKTEELINWMIKNMPKIHDLDFTTPYLAMPTDYHSDDYVKSYRDYYNLYKRHKINCTWKKREKPYWFK